MKTRNALTVILAALVVLALAFSAEAKPFGPAFGNREAGGALDALQTFLALKLTNVQQEQLQGIIAKYQVQEKELRAKMLDTRRNNWMALNATQFDEATARAAFQKGSSIREDMFILRAKMMAELKSVLTPEQLNLLKERRAERFRTFDHGPDASPQNPNQ
jgi:Spy/CpxP family protein refolding chaperone